MKRFNDYPELAASLIVDLEEAVNAVFTEFPDKENLFLKIMIENQKIKQQLQEIADTSKSTIDFTTRAAKILNIPNLNYQAAYYWIKKFRIKTKFKMGRPEKKFDYIKVIKRNMGTSKNPNF